MKLLPFLCQLFNQLATAPLAAGSLSEATILQEVVVMALHPQVPLVLN